MKNENKVAIIGTVGVPACYGGFESLAENLLPLPSPTRVYCSSSAYAEHADQFRGADLTYIPLAANGVSSIPYDILSVLHAVIKRTDVLLILGVSGSTILPFVRLFSPKTRIVCNIDGLEWRRAKWGKWASRFLKLCEKIAVKYSHEIIADNQAIQEYVAQEYGVSAHLIAYGGDHAVAGKSQEADTPADSPYAFALCRIEPENNVHLIIEGCAQAQVPLKFIGNWNNSDYGRTLRERYSNHKLIELIDPIYDINTLYRYRANCSLYLHGHSAGGTNPSLVEMMHFGKPILAFDCDYNRASTENQALFFTDADTLASLLSQDPSVTSERGEALKKIAQERYTWSAVKRDYESLIYQKSDH